MGESDAESDSSQNSSSSSSASGSDTDASRSESSASSDREEEEAAPPSGKSAKDANKTDDKEKLEPPASEAEPEQPKQLEENSAGEEAATVSQSAGVEKRQEEALSVEKVNEAEKAVEIEAPRKLTTTPGHQEEEAAAGVTDEQEKPQAPAMVDEQPVVTTNGNDKESPTEITKAVAVDNHVEEGEITDKDDDDEVSAVAPGKEVDKPLPVASSKDGSPPPKESAQRPRSQRTSSRSRSPRSRRRRGSRSRKSRSRSRSRSRRSTSLERRRQERQRRHEVRDKLDKEREREREKRHQKKRERSRSRRRDDSRKRSRKRSGDRRTQDRSTSSPGTKSSKINADNETVTEPAAKITERQRKTVDVLTSRTGGAYIPPAKLRMMQAQITDKASAAYQRIAWEALKKSIHGYINKVNVTNIAIITRELLRENIVRGRGLLSRSIIQAQAASPTFTHVYAALVGIINSKFPNIGELLLKRLVIQFRRAFRRNDKMVCMSATRFIGHLVNQRVAHEILALEILTLLVETPTDDSVEVAIAFLKECGMKLTEVSSKGIGAIFEMLRNILHEGKLDKRVQYMIEVLFQVRKDGFKDHPAVVEELELVEEDDQFTHLMMLDEATETEDILNVFKFDENYAENEDKYKGLSREILGSDDGSSSGSGSGSGSGSDSENESGSDADNQPKTTEAGDIIDSTETNLIALRRTIYLTINSSLDYEECAHKLMKMQLKPGQEIELCHMFLDCCAEQRTYEKFYGLLAQRFCNINKIYIPPFEEIFKDTYQTTHRLDTNRLRNVSKFFAHLLFTDAISWDVLECIQLNEDDTTSSSRIFIKILFQELAEYMGLGKLNGKLKEEVLVESLAGLFPKDNPRNTRFSINFFTSIGLGGLTDDLRMFLKTAPKAVPAINAEILASGNPFRDGSAPASAQGNPKGSPSSSSSASSSSSSSSSSDSSSESSSEDEESSESSSESSSSDSSSEPKKKRKRKDKDKGKKKAKKSGKEKSKKSKNKKSGKKKKAEKEREKKAEKEKLKAEKEREKERLKAEKEREKEKDLERQREKEREREKEQKVGRERQKEKEKQRKKDKNKSTKKKSKRKRDSSSSSSHNSSSEESGGKSSSEDDSSDSSDSSSGESDAEPQRTDHRQEATNTQNKFRGQPIDSDEFNLEGPEARGPPQRYHSNGNRNGNGQRERESSLDRERKRENLFGKERKHENPFGRDRKRDNSSNERSRKRDNSSNEGGRRHDGRRQQNSSNERSQMRDNSFNERGRRRENSPTERVRKRENSPIDRDRKRDKRDRSPSYEKPRRRENSSPRDRRAEKSSRGRGDRSSRDRDRDRDQDRDRDPKRQRERGRERGDRELERSRDRSRSRRERSSHRRVSKGRG
ncbi:pre-mRNA-splicing factor CWC22 homolog [Drosophila kikkawai]|uniref:Pre-mRNA-splicing factor CWC22 homolog n=1 Tax=Drosophila kikkawai TaxID=30033 RepID=A0A6P4HZF0_DROKI|nr:pre-mRNA-splicing factor CWC22 homolog [Drosophila kikkawai]